MFLSQQENPKKYMKIHTNRNLRAKKHNSPEGLSVKYVANDQREHSGIFSAEGEGWRREEWGAPCLSTFDLTALMSQQRVFFWTFLFATKGCRKTFLGVSKTCQRFF